MFFVNIFVDFFVNLISNFLGSLWAGIALKLLP